MWEFPREGSRAAERDAAARLPSVQAGEESGQPITKQPAARGDGPDPCFAGERKNATSEVAAAGGKFFQPQPCKFFHPTQVISFNSQSFRICALFLSNLAAKSRRRATARPTRRGSFVRVPQLPPLCARLVFP